MIAIMSDWLQIFDGAQSLRLGQGATLFRREDPVKAMYLVRSGVVALERSMPDGHALTLHLAVAGRALAEASLFSESYHCDAVARSEAVIASVPRRQVLAALEATPEAALSLIKAQAQEVQAQRAHIEILRLRRVQDKLDAWLTLHGAPEHGGWSRVADQIGVSPPALYRELARRRKAVGDPD